MVFIRIGEYPEENRISINKWGGVLVFWGQAITEIDHRKSFLSQAHAVELHDVFVSVNPSAAMDAHYDRQFAIAVFGQVHIKIINVFIWTIKNIVKALDVARRDKAFASFGVIDDVAGAEIFDG